MTSPRLLPGLAGLLAAASLVPAHTQTNSGSPEPADSSVTDASTAHCDAACAENSETISYLGVLACTLEPALRDTLSLAEGENGVLLTSTDPQGPAAGAGVLQGDILLSLDGASVDCPLGLQQRIRQCKPGDEVTLEILRQGARHELGCSLGERTIQPERFATLPGTSLDLNLGETLRERIENHTVQGLAEQRPHGQDRDPVAEQLRRLGPLLEALESDLNEAAHPGIEDALDLLAANGDVRLMANATTVIEVADEEGRVRIVQAQGDKPLVEIYDPEDELVFRDSVPDADHLDHVPEEHRERVREAMAGVDFHAEVELGGLPQGPVINRQTETEDGTPE